MTTTPEGFVVERCRTETCKAPIVWARTDTGNLMPVDVEPSADGTISVFALQGIVHCRVIPPAGLDRYDGPLRTSHFVTCSRPADWRKPR
jgi:hypothetical protein